MSPQNMMPSARPMHQIRQTNKEPEWSSICNDVFDQYLDTNALFGLEESDHERSSSNDSAHLFDFSGSSEQSQRTEVTSPLPRWDSTLRQRHVEARQPKAREPPDFWQKTLKALERNAAECEVQQQKLRSSKSHPDFLSLGGRPSPPPIPPPSPPDRAFPAAEQRLPRSGAKGKRRHFTSRSLSRGRPSGVVKAAVPGSVNPHATLRSHDPSPPKAMRTSRYRPGFRDLWAEKIQKSPKKYALRVPPSARGSDAEEVAAFDSAAMPLPLSGYDEHISPLTNTFRQTHIHTPLGSPTVNYAASANNASLDHLPPLPPSTSIPYMGLPSDTAPLYPERTSSLAPGRIEAFDFGFPRTSSDNGPWTSAARPAQYLDPLDTFPGGVLPSLESWNSDSAGLETSCDPSLVSNYAIHADTLPLTALEYAPDRRGVTTPYYQSMLRDGLPATPTSRSRSWRRSLSPSPPATEPRRSAREGSSTRRSVSRHHRRAKSAGTTSTPRHRAAQNGGFVNYTPDDGSKILNGVAPSGSSKTKARREKEAADKRRRLSQAAINAVVAAGGDVDALNETGLLV